MRKLLLALLLFPSLALSQVVNRGTIYTGIYPVRVENSDSAFVEVLTQQGGKAVDFIIPFDKAAADSMRISVRFSTNSTGPDTIRWRDNGATHAINIASASVQDTQLTSAWLYVGDIATADTFALYAKSMTARGDIDIYFASYELLDLSSGGGGSTETTTVLEGGAELGTANDATFDFGAGFDVSESPADEFNITLDYTENPPSISPLAGQIAGITADADTFKLQLGTADTVLAIEINNQTKLWADSTGKLTILGNFSAGGTVSGSNLSGTNTGDETISTSSAGLDVADTDPNFTVDLDVTPSSGSATLIQEEDALQVKYASPLTESASGLGLSQNAGTDITADLEEEAHASEHQDGGSDEINLQGLDAVSDADTLKIRMNTSLYGIDYEVNDTRVFGVDTLGNVVANNVIGVNQNDFQVFTSYNDSIHASEYAEIDTTNKILKLNGQASQGGRIGLQEDSDNGQNFTGFEAPASLAGNVLYTLPTADGSARQSLRTSGAKVLSWGGIIVQEGGTTVSVNPNYFSFDPSAFVASDATTTDSATVTLDVAPSSGSATLIIEEDALQVKYGTTLTEDANGLQISETGAEALLDLPDLQGQITDSQIAAGAVDGGSGGEIQDGTIDGNDITATLDLSGKTSFAIPAAAGGGTIDASGEITIDVSPLRGSLNYGRTGGTEESISPVIVKSIVLIDPAANDSLLAFGPFPWATTIDSVRAVLDGAGGVDTDTVTIRVRHSTDYSTTGPNGSGNALFSAAQAVDNFTTGERFSAFSDNTVPADSWISLNVVTKNGTVTRLVVTFYLRKDP